VYKQTALDAKLKNIKRGQKNTADWEKSIKKVKVRTAA
jgi:hypothetical protein